jgi:hypothetical protein
MLVSGIILLHRGQCGWRKDLLASFLILMSLVKPTISAPFFWIVLFVPRRIRPALVIISGYVVLTLFAASFQEPGLVQLLRTWLATGSEIAVTAGKGHADLSIGLAALGLKGWVLPVSLGVLVVIGLWVYRHRRVDLWLLVGVAAIIARFWTYHRWYDDLLILLPMVTLFRISKQGPCDKGHDVLAGVLLGITVLVMIAPGGLYLLPSPWNRLYVNVQIVVWIVILVFLLVRSHRERKAGRR